MLHSIYGECTDSVPSGGLVAGSARTFRESPRWWVEMVEGWSVKSQFRMGECENWRRVCRRTRRGPVDGFFAA